MAEAITITERSLGSRCCTVIEPQLGADQAQQLSDDLQILGHPIRLQILDMLARHAGQVCVCDLEAALPVKQPTVSHHLRLLREAGLITVERRGQWAYYTVQRTTLDTLRARLAGLLTQLAPAADSFEFATERTEVTEG